MVLSKIGLRAILISVFLLSSVNLVAQWSTSNLSVARQPASASVGNKAIFAGGGDFTGNPSAYVDIYNASTGQWTTGALSAPRSALTGTSVSNLALFAGGFTTNGVPSNVVDIYDDATGTWSTATLSVARPGLASVGLGGKAFFAGGFGDVAAVSTVDIYDAATDSWTVAQLSAARTSLAAAAAGTKVFFAGGYDVINNEQVYSNVVDIYDIVTSTWSTATLSHERAYLAAAAVGSKVMFAGGWFFPSELSDAVDIYDTSTGTWATAQLSHARSGMAAVGNGSKIFFGGGYDEDGSSNLVDIYDNATQTWSTSMLSVGRNFLAAASAGSKALFAGGFGTGAFSSVVDLYETGCNPNILTLSPNVVICAGESTTLQVSGGSSYTWTPAEGLSQTSGDEVIASPTTTTTYLVSDASLSACASVTVTVNQGPVFFFTSSTQNICNGQSVALFAIGPQTISWTPADGLSATTGSFVFANPVTTTTYEITGSDGTGCTTTTTITVNVNDCHGWSPTSLSEARFDLASASLPDKVVFAGGYGSIVTPEDTFYATVDIFDRPTEVWTTDVLSEGRGELAGTSYANKAYFGGGRGASGYSDVVDIYDGNDGTWATSTLSAPRSALAATSAGGIVFFAGGSDNGVASDVVDMYDVNTGTWTVAHLSEARWSLTAVAVDTKVFFAGGFNGSYSDRVDIYDVVTQTWSTATLSVPRSRLASAAVGTKVIFAGGRNGLLNPTEVTTVDIFDTSTGVWSTEELSVGRSGLAAATLGSKVLIGGGYAPGENMNTVDIFDNVTDNWGIAHLSLARSSLAAASTGDLVFFAGGDPGNVVDIFTTEFCEPVDVWSSESTICNGASTTFYTFSAGGYSYEWSPSASLSSDVGFSVIASPTTHTEYTVTATDGLGCIVTASLEITVNPSPDVIVSPDVEICSGLSATVSATGADEYSWSPTTGFLGSNQASVEVFPSITTSYTVTGTTNGCGTARSVTVTVIASPVVSVTAPSSICLGETAFMEATGADTYEWIPVGDLSPTSGSQVSATPTVTTQYTVEGTSTNGCTDISSVTVTVYDLNLQVSPSIAICLGEIATLQATGADTYYWSPVDGLLQDFGSTVQAQPTTTTTYTVQGSLGGCVDEATVVVGVNPPDGKPIITNLGSNGMIFLQSDRPTGNQWYVDGNLIPGAIEQILNVSSEGIYTVLPTSDQCPTMSDPFEVHPEDLVTGLTESSPNAALRFYPNPATETVHIQWLGADEIAPIDLHIMESTGRTVIRAVLPSEGGNMDVSALSPGVYILQAVQGSKTLTQKMIKSQ